MNIPFWEPAREYMKHKSEIDAAITGCLERGELVLGYLDEINNFERDFAKLIGTRYAVMCGSGTQALHLAYRALDIGRGDEVITTSHTFIATIDQIVAVGAKPVLVDIDERTGLIDPQKVEQAITRWTKAIVPVHLEGRFCDMEAIMAIAEKHNLLVIEDAAQAIGAMGVGQGDAQCFSLYPAKILGCIGNAGVLTTNDEKVANRAKMLRCNYNIGRQNKSVEEGEFGHNFEPDAIQAAILNVKLKYLPERLKRRFFIAREYDSAFADLPITLPIAQTGRVYQDYVIRVEEPERLQAFLKEKGIGTIGVGLIPNHHYKNLGLNFNLPKTDEYTKKQIRIPCNPDLVDEEIGYIIKSIREFYGK